MRNNLILEELLKKLGRLDKNGYAYKPQKFVEYCRQNTPRAIEKRRTNVIQYLKKSASIYGEISCKEISTRTKMNLSDLKILIEDLIFQGEFNAQLRSDTLVFEKIASTTIQNSVDKLKRILNVSNSIKMEQMRDKLDLDKKTFNKKILDWAEEFDFIIDRDYFNINKNTIDSFINQLDRQFEVWDKMETSKSGKL